jgi:aminotransferase
MRDISNREMDLPEAMIGELLKIASESKDVISMSVGEPDFITPKPLLDYAKKVIGKSTHYAPSAGKEELREAIAKKLAKENGIKDADPEKVIVRCGSQEALFTGLLSAIDPGEEVVIQNPGYLGYLPAVDLVNGVPKFIELKEDDEFAINPDKLRKIVDKRKTRVIILNTPANPTGNVLSRKILEEVADIAVEKDVYIFSDEAYEKIIYPGEKHISIGSLNGMENYVMTFQTFSKTYAMCGFRLGYAHGPKKLIDAMDKASNYITLSAPHISQLMGIKALSLPKKYIDEMVKEYDKRRSYTLKRLNEIGLNTVMPRGTFYAFSNIKNMKMNSLNFCRNLLKEQKVAVVPGTEFGSAGEGYLRFSYATKMPLIEKALDRVEKFVSKR